MNRLAWDVTGAKEQGMGGSKGQKAVSLQHAIQSATGWSALGTTPCVASSLMTGHCLAQS